MIGYNWLRVEISRVLFDRSVRETEQSEQIMEVKIYLKEIVIEVWGDFACFSMPYAKVERLTYPFPPHPPPGAFSPRST